MAAAALFWLHVRYLPISFALLAGLAYAATSDLGEAGDGPAKRAPMELLRRVRTDSDLQ